MRFSPPPLALLGATVALLVVVSGFGLEGASAAAPAIVPPPGADPALNATLQVSSSEVVLNQSFWGTTVSARAPFFSNESALINATGTDVALWPGAFAGDDYDPFNNQLYYGATDHYTARTTEAQFVAWCKSVNCTAIMELPGEMNNATFAAQVVQYTEQNLSFTPAYWEIGNEPGLWSHWTNYPATWANWTGYTGAPDAIQYAWEEWNYTQAIKPIDPGFKFIGIPGVGPGGVLYNWINATLALNGPNITGMAVHVYPDVTGANDPLSTFYHYLNVSNYNSIPGRVPSLNEWIRDGIAYSPSCQRYGCGPIPVMFTEMGSAISGRSDGTYYSKGFAGALFMAAEFVQAFAANITTVEAYGAVLDTVNSWYTISGEPRPLYALYTDVLSHLGPDIYPATLTVRGDPAVSGNLYATESVNPADGGREDLMVVNTNQLNNVSITPALTDYTPGNPVEVWEWNGTNISGPNGNNVAPSSPEPVASFLPDGLPSNWTVPEQSVVLFEAWPGGGAPVHLTETGLPNNTRWFVGVGSLMGTSPTPTITMFLPTGSYDTVPGPAIGVSGHLADERWAPAPPTRFTLESSAVNVSVPYSLQYHLNLTVTPNVTGSIDPSVNWADANSTVNLTAFPGPGYAFKAWYGWGNGSYNGSLNPAPVTLLGPLHETAIFAPAFLVEFQESGLPVGTLWSVDVRGDTISGSTSVLSAWEANGTYQYAVASVPGYHPSQAADFVNVSGAPLDIAVKFSANLFYYTVEWSESGLRDGTAWSVVVRGVTYLVSTPSVSVPELNGTYGFQVTPVAGYNVTPVSSFVSVEGSGATVSVTFSAIPGLYPVDWRESGLPPGTAWSVTVRGTVFGSSGTEIELWEKNGTYSYAFDPIPGFRAAPSQGGFTVDGAGITVSVTWTPGPATLYLVTFSVGSTAPGSSWTVSVANRTENTTGATIEFSLANGTYHFSVTPPPGHYVTPGGGTVLVTGGPQLISLSLGVSDPTVVQTEATELTRALPVIGVLALVGLGTFLLFSRRARRPVAASAAAGTTAALPEYMEDAEPPLGSKVAPDYHEDVLPR